VAAHSTVPIAALADLVLRLPERTSDPALHDTVLAACRDAGVAASTGRPVHSLEDAAVEIGMSTRDATVVCGCAGDAGMSVAVRPLAPLVEVSGVLLTRPPTTPACLDALVAALA
jgi:hypothetical protein